MKHKDIWNAVDQLAREHGLSPSGLARKAGLDPTTFNKSKRETREGKMRWPSTESVAKILDATGAGLDQFVSFMGEGAGGAGTVPLIGFAQAGKGGHFDDAGYPVGQGWDAIPFPGLGDPHAFALEISGDSMMPVFRDGDRIIVSPAVSVRRGDRVVLKTRSGEVMAKELVRQTATRVELKSLNAAHADVDIPAEEVEWLWRIIWSSQ